MIYLLQKSYIYIFAFFSAFIIRFFNYHSPPKEFAMDEIYYIPQSISILRYGYEKPLVDNYNAKDWISDFSESFFNGTGTFASNEWLSSHPPFGKMLIAIGMFFFGDNNPLGWKIAAIVAGSLTVIFAMLIANKIFHNKAITILTGFFLALDPMSIAMSRTVHLDIFLTLMVAIAIYYTILYVEKPSVKFAILLSFFFALASSIKWSGIYFYVFFGIALLIHMLMKNDFLRRWKHIIISVIIYITTYLFTWSFWIINYGLPKTGNIFSSILYLLEEHATTITAHTSLTSTHPYKTNAFEWIVSSRPSVLQGIWGNDKETIIAVVSTPNLILWITSIIALIVIAILSIKQQNSVVNKNYIWILYVGIAAGWLPWFFVGDRIIFQFYTVVFQPYLYILLATLFVYMLSHSATIQGKVYRMIALILILFSTVISIFMYSSAVGLNVPYKNSGYEFTSKWQTLMAETGLYDVNQMPEESRKIYD